MKKITAFIVFILILLINTNVNAKTIAGGKQVGIDPYLQFTDNDLPYYNYPDYKSLGLHKIIWSETGTGGGVITSAIYQIDINGKVGVCLDFDKPYCGNSRLKADKVTRSTALLRTYAYSLLGTDEYIEAQIIFWYLGKKGLLTTPIAVSDEMLKNILTSSEFINEYQLIQGLLGPNSDVGYIEITFKNGTKEDKELIDARDLIVDDSSMCNTIFRGYGTVTDYDMAPAECKTEGGTYAYSGTCYNPSGGKVSGIISSNQCAMIPGSNWVADKYIPRSGCQLFANKNGSSKEQYYWNKYLGTYDVFGYSYVGNSDYYSLCQRVNEGTNDYNTKLARIQSIGGSVQLNEFLKDVNTGTGLALYNKIYDPLLGNIPDYLVIYAPEDAECQRVISAPPSEDKPTCQDVLGALKSLYGYTNAKAEEFKNNKQWNDALAELVKKYPGSKDYILGEVPYCKDSITTCWQTINIYSDAIKRPNMSFSAKKNNSLFTYTRNLVSSTTINVCDGSCESEKDKFGPGKKYGCDCDRFKAALATKGSDVICDPVACTLTCTSSGIPGSGTCASMLATARQKKWDLKTFKNNITDPEHAEINSKGQLDCNTEPPCEPESTTPTIDKDGAYCHPKWGGTNIFTMSDSGDGTSAESKICYANSALNNGLGIAYKQDGEKISSRADDLSNSYCTLYCWESLTATMPQDFQVIDGSILAHFGYIISGRQFFWGLNYGNHLFATINTKRICYTNTTDYNKFATDWNNNENAIAKAIASYKAKEKYNNKNDGVYQKGECCYGGSYGTETETKLFFGTPEGWDCKFNQQKYFNGSGPYDEYVCTKSTTTCSGTKGHNYNKRAESDSYTSVTGSTFTESSGEASDICALSAPAASEFKVSNSTDTIKSLINNRGALRRTIDNCQSTRDSNTTWYTYTTKMSINVEKVLGSGQKVNKDLVSSADGYINGTEGAVVGQTGTYCTNIPSELAGLGTGIDCNNSPVTMYSDYTWTYNGINNFYYNDSFEFSVVKNGAWFMNNLSSSTTLQNIGDQEVKYDPKYGIPVSFNTATGVYDVSVDISGLGNNGHFDNFKDPDDTNGIYDYKKYECPVILQNILYENDCRYVCTDTTCTLDTRYKNPNSCPKECGVNATCAPIKDNGIDVVYRLIEMAAGDKAKIFPGIEGEKTGRNPGYNWSSFISSNNKKFKAITDASKVYKTEPLYSIELTPSVITEIRNSNKEYRNTSSAYGGAKDPYTSYYDSKGNYKIKCIKSGVDQSCVSTYITELINKGVITGLFATVDEDKRMNYIYKYKTCYNKDATCLNQ